MRRRPATISAAAAVLLALALPCTASAAAAFKVTLKVPGPHPKAETRWPVTVTVKTLSGKPLRATLRYLFLYKGQIVSRQSNYHFKGRYTDTTFVWPSRAVGIPLTLRCQITTSLGTRVIDYRVRVRA